MTHALGEATLAVPTEELWLKVIDEGVPFHRFHHWVENELTKRYLATQLMDRIDGNKPSDLREHRRSVLASVVSRHETLTRRKSLCDEP
jgi:hypothetical protein